MMFGGLPVGWRWAARVGSALLVAVLLTGLLAVWTVRQPFPQRAGAATLPGLSAEVTVLRDATGVPHVYADTSADLFAGQGYVHAQDRFWEMDVRRHTTAGRLSELFGEATLTEDRVIRTLGWRRVAEQELPLLDRSTRAHLDAYAVGVNAWLAQHDAPRERALEYVVLGLTGVDAEPEPWTALDSLAWLKAMAWDLRTNLPDELARAAATDLPADRLAQLYPAYPFDRHPPIDPDPDPAPAATPEVVPAALMDGVAEALDAVPVTIGVEGGGGGLGSNSWVVSGEHTSTGAPLLSNDPHLGSSLPSVWHQVGLHCRSVGPQCPFDVTGFSFSGLPGVVIGHNDRIGWGFTNLGADVMDLYVERVDATTYEVAGSRVPLTIREERIEVAGGEPVELTVRSTANGPIVSDVLDVPGPEAVSLRWTALDPGRTADSIFALNAAQDWSQFREALRFFEVPGQNIVYADVDGNIGYQATGRVPVRAAGDGRAPAPGWTGTHGWTGTIPYDEMPSVLNPAQGWIVTANNAVVERPGFTTDWARGYRSQRIRDLLTGEIARGPVDAATMQRVQFDSRIAFADDLVPALLAVDTSPAVDLLRGWDGSHGVDSAPAAYFNAVWRHLLIRTFDDELTGNARPGGGDRWFEVVRALPPEDPFWDDVTTPARENRDDMLRAAAADANTELDERLGGDPASWRWGDLHRLELTHATLGTSGIGPVEWLFNRGPYPVGGSRDAVAATSWDAQAGYEVTAVPSMRMVVDLADLDASRWIDHTGVSGHAFHGDYADQTELWVRGETVPMPFSTAAVEAAAAHTLTLAP